MSRLLTLVLTLLIVTSDSLHARAVPLLSYKELFDRAEAVFICRPISTRDLEGNVPPVAYPRKQSADYLAPVVTRFVVLAVLKGEHKRPFLDIEHFRYDWEKFKERNPDSLGVINGPNLVVFKKAKRRLDPDVPNDHDCMIFLKRGANGQLTFVTGLFDPKYSVIGMAFPSGEDR